MKWKRLDLSIKLEIICQSAAHQKAKQEGKVD
jgi:hypothetical protein